MIIEYYRLRPEVREPTRANPSDAGLDLYFSPLLNTESNFRLDPGKNHMFPTGLKFGIPHGYMLQVCNRSSMGAKKSLLVGAHIIDSGYDGEVFIDLHNVGSEPQLICGGDKIAQGTMSQRGQGALGSTNVNDLPHPLNGMPSGF